MNLMDALKGRRSVRSYQDRPVSREILSSLITAAKTAPSAGNLRARSYIVVTRRELRTILALAAFGQSHIAQAPALIVICAEPKRSARRYGERGVIYSISDACAAAVCLLLAAHDMGLGACWNGAFDDDTVKEALSLHEGQNPLAIISIGWPEESPAAPGGMDKEAVRWETD